MAGWMLDTNAASAVIKSRSPELDRRIAGASVCISVITEAELRFGIVRRRAQSALVRTVEAFLACTQILPWTSETARIYGDLRAELEAKGRPLGALDLLIAAHALSERRTLMTADEAFAQVPGLALGNWSPTS